MKGTVTREKAKLQTIGAAKYMSVSAATLVTIFELDVIYMTKNKTKRPWKLFTVKHAGKGFDKLATESQRDLSEKARDGTHRWAPTQS